jgi:hypothetical protein
MKQIQLIAYIISNIILFVLVALAFLSIVVIAEMSSWYLLLLYIPIGFVTYHTEAVRYKNKKHAVARK